VRTLVDVHAFASQDSGEESGVEGFNMGTQRGVSAGSHKEVFILD
jgi:hypothetical protein